MDSFLREMRQVCASLQRGAQTSQGKTRFESRARENARSVCTGAHALQSTPISSNAEPGPAGAGQVLPPACCVKRCKKSIAPAEAAPTSGTPRRNVPNACPQRVQRQRPATPGTPDRCRPAATRIEVQRRRRATPSRRRRRRAPELSQCRRRRRGPRPRRPSLRRRPRGK